MSAIDLIRITPEESAAIQRRRGKTNEEIREYVSILQQWINQENHMPKNLDRKLLETFIISCKFSLEKAKVKIETYCLCRNLLPELYEQRNPFEKAAQRNLTEGFCFAIPKLTKDLNRLMIMKLLDPNIDRSTPWTFFKLLTMGREVMKKYDETDTHEVILDFENGCVENFAMFTPTILKRVLTLLQKSSTERIQAIHVINVPKVILPFLNMVIYFAVDKLKKRVVLHKDLDSLHKCVSKDILPSDYNGKERSLLELQGQWKKLLESEHEFITQRNKLKCTENYCKNINNCSDDFGLNGSFRKLNFD